jgi:hypothetical protein
MKANTIAEICFLSLLMFTDVEENRYPIFFFCVIEFVCFCYILTPMISEDGRKARRRSDSVRRQLDRLE